jgi:inosine/xanthosine triphosphatase
MKIIVGSTNPVKIAAAQAVFAQLDPEAKVGGVVVESGVPDQPWGDEETRAGAVNRARAALTPDAAYGVGFEGGLLETEHGLMTCAWCAVVDEAGRLGLGGGVNVLLPPAVGGMVRAGRELGEAMDQVTGENDTKRKEGAVGILTDGLSDRQRAYEHMLALALAPFRRPALYQNGGK